MNICIVGLGYVGLPLAVEFAKKYDVVGLDINKKRIEELQDGFDRTLEVETEELNSVPNLRYVSDIEATKACDIYIVTVPTPIDNHKNPDLTPLIKSSQAIATVLKKGDIVIYESTVFPGCTEEVCVPLLEQSGLLFNEDFFCGYSPERINPGDKQHRLPSIKKVTSGSTPATAQKVDALYASIITAGTHLAPSIKVAEAAKVIENSQRDINIAFVNELAMIFERLDIDTKEVLEAAGTKWNFLKFSPGLVGGHCIGVDPYYLTYKAKEVGYQPEVILSGRRINDNMGIFIANKVIKLMIKHGHKIKDSRVLVLGVTFKENCPDIRNSRVVDVIAELQDFGCHVDVYDPWADKEEVAHEYGIEMVDFVDPKAYDATILAVAHDKFKEIALESAEILYDIKAMLPKELVSGRL